jgi:hypothetical protein
MRKKVVLNGCEKRKKNIIFCEKRFYMLHSVFLEKIMKKTADTFQDFCAAKYFFTRIFNLLYAECTKIARHFFVNK